MNRATLIGNLCRDVELTAASSGTAIAKLRVAVNSRTKDATGEWIDKPNYFDVTVFGAQAERCAQYLAKGSRVGVDGRLEWREWDDKTTGAKRQAVEIVANEVDFLSAKGETGQLPAADFGTAVARRSGPDIDIPF